ncbi:IclR family transcriptional regulator [Labrys miyagiensis]|uniref:IclR family transcriptional regulator n=1 Tax=Labrys miyagiensis TaxID=346912 RepID=A0ABQ6CEG7_9HYPH|nr:IclR family transcriptional regulator [Labrys miyagiensis]GLS18052.1 IclR family transcriptional regulator [Labrys miyagiensis]
MTGNLSLERGLSVLQLLRVSDEPLGVRELARRLDLSAPAVQRILNTLAQVAYVEQDPPSRRYRLGPSLLSLAQNMLREDRLVRASQGELELLAEAACLNAFLGIRRGDQGIYLLAVQSKSPVVIRSSPGETFSLHSTAMGKALLLNLTPEQIVEILGSGPFKQHTHRTATDVGKLHGHIRAARAAGYTTSLDENFVGLIAVGAPVLDASARIIGAISVAYPKAVGPQIEIAEVGEMIIAAAARISTSLGYREKTDPFGKDPSDVAE